MMMRTLISCISKLIGIFALGRKGPIRFQGCEILSFRRMKGTVQIKAIIVRSNFHVNISEQFKIRECMRPSFKGYE